MSHHEKINKDTTIAEALSHNPKAAQVFMRYGMHCLGCASATGETIAQAAIAHGVEVDKLLKELNEA